MPLKHTVTELALKNGAKGLIIDVPGTTVVSYQFQFRAGNDYVTDPKKQQTAHIMEHMAFGANKKFGSVEAFSQEFSKNGAWSNAITWDRNMIYYANCALMEWDRILDLQQLSITQPVFKQNILDAEKGNVREELVGNANNHTRVMWERIYRAKGEPSALDVEKIKTINNVTLNDIRRHHDTTHTLHNMRFIIAGDLEKHHAEIEKNLENWQLTPGEALPAKTYSLHSARPLSILRTDMSNIRFGISISLNRHFAEDEQTAMGALNHILNGTFHSRIWGKARVRGLCYSMGSSTSTDIDGVTNWEFYGQVANENATPLFELITTQLKKVGQGEITDQELEEAKQYALGGYQMRAQTVGDLASWYSDYFDDGKIDYITDSPMMIQQTQLKTITSLAQEFMEQGNWVLGTIGNMPTEKTEELSAILSNVLQESKIIP